MSLTKTKFIQNLRNYAQIRWRRLPRLAGLKVSKKPIVLVYQMGKVGSTSIYRALKAAYAHRFELYHTHFLNANYALALEEQRQQYGWQPFWVYDKTRMLHQAVVEPNHPLNIITLVRDPISRNISAYFNNLHLVWGIPDAYEQKSLDELAAGFWERETHELPVEWIDREFGDVLGVDIYDHPFPHERGMQIFQSGNHNFLIMQLGLSDKLKEESVCKFLGIDHLKMVRANTADAKAYASTYKRFLHEVEIPEWYVEKMFNSQFACHFFSEQERQIRMAYWLKHPR